MTLPLSGSTHGPAGGRWPGRHARSGDPVAITEYLGDSDTFDRGIADFAKRDADQNERDYQAFVGTIRSGRLQALEGI